MKDENPDLQKQIGCISGFFQLFDRHSFLTGQSNSSHNQNIPNNKGNLQYICYCYVCILMVILLKELRLTLIHFF